MSPAYHVDRSHPVTLWLPFEYQWALHHLLLDRIQGAAKAGTQTSAGPLESEVYEAFEVLDGGDVRFTLDQIEAMQRVLRSYRRETASGQRQIDEIEELLDRLSTHLATHRTTAQTDRRRGLDLTPRIDGTEQSG